MCVRVRWLGGAIYFFFSVAFGAVAVTRMRVFNKSVSISLIIGSRGLQCTVDPSFKVKLGRVSIKVPISCLLLVLGVSNVQLAFRKPYAANLLVMSNLTLDPSVKMKLGLVSLKVPFWF